MNNPFPKFKLSLQDWIAILCCAVPAFYLLGTPAIYIWDEAVYANASFDMAHGSSWLVPVDGAYNTKPPLVLWMQAVCLWIIPSAEWAVRLPSAMAVFGILWMLQGSLKRWGFDFWTRLFVMVCFVAHEGFIRHHIARTADLDAVMTFFVTAYTMVMLDAIHQNKWTQRHQLFFFLGLICAFYAKSVAGWMMVAPLGVVLLLTPLRSILLTMRFWMGGMLVVCFSALYYLIREQVQPGFLELVWHSEYLRIAKNIMPWHEHGASYYFTNFVILKTYTPWVFFLIASIGYVLFILKDRSKRFLFMQWIVLALGYMLVITFPAVKLEWYDAPAYPFFAMIMGGVAGHLICILPARWRLFFLLPAFFLIGFKLEFIYQDIKPRHHFENEGAMLRIVDVNPSTKVFMKVETPEHQLQLDFYRRVVLDEKGIQVPVLDTISAVNVGDEIIISQNDQLAIIQDHFTLDTLRVWEGLGFMVKVREKVRR